MKHALTLIVVLPLVGFLLNGFLATRFGGNRVGRTFVTAIGCGLPIAAFAAHARLPLPPAGGRLGAARRDRLHLGADRREELRDRVLLRPPDRGDDADRHRRRLADPRLLRRLHEGRRELRALLRVPQPVPVLHAPAGARPFAAGALRRLGGRRPRLVPADRLLVRAIPEKAAAGKKAFIVNRIGDAGFLLGMFVLWSDRRHAGHGPHQRGVRRRGDARGVGEPRRRAAVHRRDRQVGADTALRLAARRDGGPDARCPR